MTDKAGSAFSRLVDIMARLRAPDGCPWDREQTHESLKRYLLEEAYEALEAVDRQDPGRLTEELGDVLLQIVFHAQIAQEAGDFGIETVVEALSDKLVRRHPHVFGDSKVKDAREVEANWESLKRQERGDQEESSILGKVPTAMPALAYSQLIQDRAAGSGFDWPSLEGVLDKVAEEVREIQEAASQEEKAREFGDVLFAVVNAGRWLGVQAEDALRQANARFARRFQEMERLARERGLSFKDLPLDAKEKLWQEVKGAE